MKKLAFVLALLSPGMLHGQSAFTGTWRWNLQNQQVSGKRETYLLKDGVYRCDSCVPKFEVKADGQDHERKGSPYSDTISLHVVDDHTIAGITKKSGKVVGTRKDTVSPDGKTLTIEWTSVSENGTEGEGKSTLTRVAPAPEGAHIVSGSWGSERLENASENEITITFSATDDGLNMGTPLGESYTANFDGKDYPFKGDPGITSIALKKVDNNTIEETDKREGKAVYIKRMTVSSDGRTMTFEVHDLLFGQERKSEATKQ